VGTTVEVRDGRPVLVRIGEGTGADAIRHEARVLTAIAGPGTPAVLEFEDAPTYARLVLRVAPPATLSRLPRTSAIPALARVAEVLARAHAAGISHGPLRDGDVLIDREGALLAGWDRAGCGTAEADVVSFGRLVGEVAGADRALRAIAGRTTAPDPPTMAALAEALRGVAPTVVGWRRPLPSQPVRVVAALVGAAVVGLLLSTRPSQPPPETARSPSSGVVRSNVVERSGRRWAVGKTGDVVAIGRWHCDGEGVPAVLRPETGQIWVFSAWPDGDAPVAGHPARVVPEAVRLRIRHEGRCDRLDAVDAQGRSTPVR
jgi:hypothetical protein